MPNAALVDRYRDQAFKLLPPGRALSRLVTGGLGKLLEAVAVEYARAHERLDTLLLESFPGTSTDTELLPQWEKATGLPNACTGGLSTEAQRQQAVLDQLHTGLGQSTADFQGIATGLGYGLDIETNEAFLTGVHPIGHMPLYSDPWLFAGKFSYEESGAAVDDAALECSLRAHAHSYTQVDFNPWDATPAQALTGLRSHFVHGEFTTSPLGLSSKIDSWNNREGTQDLVQGALSNANTAVVGLVNGWSAADLNEPTPRALQGGYIRTAAVADTLLKHGDFNMFMVYQVDSLAGPQQNILATPTEIQVSVNLTVVGRVQCDYNGATLTTSSAPGRVHVLSCAANGATLYMRLDDGLQLSVAHAGGPYTDEQLLLGGAMQGSVVEIITSDFTGPPGTSATVDAVTDYLLGKYGLT